MRQAIAVSASVAAGGLLASALTVPSLSASAEDSDPMPPAALVPKDSAAMPRAAGPFRCYGGATKAVRDLGIASGTQFDVPAGASKLLPGKIKLKGPKKGKDTISIAVTGLGYLEAGQVAYLNVLLDGKPLRPGTKVDQVPFMLAPSTTAAPLAFATGAAQFCGKIGKGRHTVKVRLTNPASYTTYLYHATTHLERTN